MITCTQEVRELFMASHRQVMRITLDNSVMTDTVYAVLSDASEVPLGALSLSDGTEAGADAQWGYFRGYIQDMSDGVEITEDDILVGGFVLDRYSMCTERIEIGSAVSAELTLTLQNMDGTFDAVRFEGAEMHVELGVKDWDTDDPVQWISLGYFTADKQPKNSTTVKVTALDRMVWFDKDIDWSRFTFPCTLKTLIEGACTACGVTLATDLTTLPNYNYEVTYSPETTLPYRTLIQWGAFLTGTCAQMNEDGELVFRWYTPCGVTITAENRYSHDIEEEDITLTGLYYKSEMGLEYLEGTADYALEMSGCQILQNNIETALTNIYQARNGFSYRPFSAVIQSAPFLEPLDMITFVDKNSVSHQCIISKTTYTGNASTPVSGVGETATQASYANLTGLTRAQAEAVDDAKKYATNYVSSDSSGIMIANMTDGQRYLPSNVPAGVKNTFIDNNSFDVRDGQTSIASFGTETTICTTNGTELAHFGYALGESETGQAIAPYYTMGKRTTGGDVGNWSFTTGEDCEASAPWSTAMGVNSEASGNVSFAVGNDAVASGQNSISMGVLTTADAAEAVALGRNATASGLGAIAIGYGVSAAGAHQFVRGRWNAEKTGEYLDIVGNGNDQNHPSNAYALKYNGDILFEFTHIEDEHGTFNEAIYHAIAALGWENDVIVDDDMINLKSLLTKILTRIKPRVLSNTKITAPATALDYASKSVDLAGCDTILVRCGCNNITQLLTFTRPYGDATQMLSEYYGTTYFRGLYKVDWDTNQIQVAYGNTLSGRNDLIWIHQVYAIG